jgi:hypothetical protein
MISANLAALGAPATDDEFRNLRKQAAEAKDILSARAIISKMFNEHQLEIPRKVPEVTREAI